MCIKNNLKRLAALILCAAIFLGALPISGALPINASAASWATPYVDKMEQWGVMNDGRPDDYITRAEMAAMLNRAFGFTRRGPIPFTDVKESDWFYNDIVTCYTEGILQGTSSTTVSPRAYVTREQALVFIARSLRFDESKSEVTEFTDGQDFSTWSSYYVRSAVLAGIVSGMADGSFRPAARVTRGQVAKMLSIGLGNLVKDSGETSLGGVFGNVTINTSNVTLKDTVISGDLYLTGGVSLGDVVLDNVRVLGRIIIAGGGEAESGQASIVLNNVEAQKLLVDPATGQYVSLRAVGSTFIPETVLRSEAHIQDDVRDNDKGLNRVEIQGPDGGKFIIAGNMKDVINKAPNSTLQVGDTVDGSVGSITVDENATGSHLVLDINASVDNVHLDTATDVTGKGDIGTLDVGTNGSTSEILPDEVIVRPGVTTGIKDMPDVDSEQAKEISEDPRLLEGYPKVKAVAPTSAVGVFSVNKAGTIYWALTSAGTGPLDDLDADDLIEPGYSSGFMSSGSIQAAASKTEYTENLTGMEPGGVYYISAILTDAHGRRSAVKSRKITTPDDTVPALIGTPTITDRTPTRDKENKDKEFYEIADLQATVMANKSCDLYYVLLSAGSSQPKTSEFLSASFPDPFGFGRIRLIKNTLDSFRITDLDMDLNGVAEGRGKVVENTSYDLYLWLTDSDGNKSSKITKITVKTKDITPPEFNLEDMIQTNTQATSVRLTNSINEAGTVYWVAVENGAEYPIPKDGMSSSDPEFLSSEYAKLQVINGLNGFKSGKVTAKANTDFTISISGLAKESAYDVYYLAVDAAGNYSDPIKKYTVHTLDQSAPTATQEFENYPDDSPTTPYSDSTVNIIFSEDIRYKQPSNSQMEPYEDPSLLSLYNNYAAAKKANPSSPETLKAEELYIGALRDMIVLYDGTTRRPVAERTAASSATADWTIDYRNVQVFKEGAKMVVSFINGVEPSSLNLESGASYYFHLKNIADESERHNQMPPTTLPQFTTVSAQVVIGRFEGGLTLNAFGLTDAGDIDSTQVITSKGDDDQETTDIPIDIAFTAEPRSTANTADGVYWDMLFWFDTSVEFELFTRIKGEVSDPWTQVGGDNATVSISVPDGATDMRGTSVIKNLGSGDYQYINKPYSLGGVHCGLNDSEETIYEYALHFVRIGNNTTRSTFSQLVNGQVTFITGAANSLGNQANSLSLPGAFDNVIGNRNGVTEITFPKDLDSAERLLTKQFSDNRAPQLLNETPNFEPTDSGVTMRLQLDRTGTVYYVLAPMTKDDQGNEIPFSSVYAPTDQNHNNVPEEKLRRIATSGTGLAYTGPDGVSHDKGATLTTSDEFGEDFHFVYPNSLNIMNPRGTGLTSPLLTTGSTQIGEATTPVEIDGLSPNTTYYIYLVTQGTSDILSEVRVYQFKTKPITRPVITLTQSSSNITIHSNIDAVVDYMVVPYSTQMDDVIKAPFVYDPTIQPPDGAPTDLLVYTAMGRNVVSGIQSVGSWFDVYGQQTDKDTVADYIRTTQPNNSSVLGTGSGNVKANSPLTVNCAKDFELKPGIQYCFLVVGRSSENSGDAFRATYPFSVADNDAPVIDSVNNTLYAYQLKDDTANRWYIGGTLRLTFNEPLCYLTGGSGDQQTLTKVTNSSTGGDGFTKTSDIVEKPLDAGVKIFEETGGPLTQAISITISFSVDNDGKPIQMTTFTEPDGTVKNQLSNPTDIFNCSPSGASVTFFPGLSDANYNARMDNPLSVNVKVVNGQPQVNIPKAWLRNGLNPNV